MLERQTMPTIESIILRRCYPVQVTFSDLRQAYASLWYSNGASMDLSLAMQVIGIRLHCIKEGLADHWHAAIKEATGAIDEVYAVIDGHEIRVATVTGIGETATANMFGPASAGQVAEVLIAADEAGYWERPHEVRVVFQERMMSRAAVERAVNVGWTARGGSA